MLHFVRLSSVSRKAAFAGFASAALITSPVFAQESSGTTGPAPGSIAVVFSPSFTSVRNDSNSAQAQGLSTDRKLGLGGGLLFDAPLANSLSLGVGALYIARKFQIGTGSFRIEHTAPTVFVPVEAKLWLGNVLSIGAGAFGAVRVGDAKDELVSGSSGLGVGYAQDRKSVDYGLTASVNLLFPFMERTGFVLGARYLYGLSNSSDHSPVYDEHIDDLALTAGLSFSM